MFGYTIVSKKRLRELENPANDYAKYYLAGYEAGKQDALYKRCTSNELREALGLEEVSKVSDAIFRSMEREIGFAMLNNPKAVKHRLSIDFYISRDVESEDDEFLFKVYSIIDRLSVRRFLPASALVNPLFSYENLINLMVDEWVDKKNGVLSDDD